LLVAQPPGALQDHWPQLIVPQVKALAGKRGWLSLAAVLLGGCVSGSDIDQIQHQLAEIQEELSTVRAETSNRVEIERLSESIGAQSADRTRSDAETALALEDLARRMHELQAQLGDTNYRLAQLAQQISTAQQELISAQRQPPAGADTAGATEPTAPGPAPSDPQSLYQSAYNDYLRGNYDLAILSFRQYLESYPTTDLADNAAYWIGESYFSQGKYREAVREFERIAGRYPRSDKMASVLLKTGYAYLELDDAQNGVEQLQRVVREYPASDEANLGAQRLRTLGVDSN
jgi:tol-pal system protein YbgF